MPLPDRAENVLARLLLEPRLRNGPITLIGHSLGGLVAIQLLHSANREADANQHTADLLHRIRKVAFLGTPHRGSGLADFLRRLGPFARQSSSTAALGRNDANLRSLNLWYRQYCRDHGIQNLVLTETRGVQFLPLRFLEGFGFVVKPDSSDPGVTEPPIPIDADHIDIAKPRDRDAEVYLHVKGFLGKPLSQLHGASRLTEAITAQAESLEALQLSSKEQVDSLRVVQQSLGRAEHWGRLTLHPGNARIIDGVVEERLAAIIRKRHFVGFDLPGETRIFAESLQAGELSAASDGIRGNALAWCARFLSNSDAARARDYLQLASALGTGEAITIAEAFFRAYGESDFDAAIKLLSPFASQLSRSAAFVITSNTKGFKQAMEWLRATGYGVSDLGPDTKSHVLQNLLVQGKWEAALDVAENLSSADLEATPSLGLGAADAYLAQSVPVDERALAIHQIPFEARAFPLAADPLAMQRRRKALDLYKATAEQLILLGLQERSVYPADKALWLALRDPDLESDARKQLASSMRDREAALRRVPLALQFGLEIDEQAVEREIERQTALHGGSSVYAATARLALAFSQNGPAAVAEYIDRHRRLLEAELNAPGIAQIEMQMLAAAGLSQQAERRLRMLQEQGLGEQELSRLRRIISEAAGADPIQTRLATYEDTKRLSDLRSLVSALEDNRDWSLLATHARVLFDSTHDAEDLKYLAKALYEVDEPDALLELLDPYAELVNGSAALLELQCLSLYETGRFEEAKVVLHHMRTKADRESYRQLEISIAIGSGDWEGLQVFIEEQWRARDTRSPLELLRAAQLAQRIGSPRARELTFYTAELGKEEPRVLIGCYSVATDSGYEGSAEVAGWLQNASALSGSDGPVQMITLEEVVARQPDWERREAETFAKLMEGKLPIFAAGQLLNRSQLSLSLLPSLMNLKEPDVRKRSIVHAFSGARLMRSWEPRSLMIDVSALVTAEFLGVLTSIIENFELIVVPHLTMQWLFEERAKIAFHQPSRVDAARDLQRLLVERKLQVHESSGQASLLLATEVGPQLADMLVAAATAERRKQHFVVHSYPVHRVTSLMQQEAELGEYESVMASCSAIVDALVEQGLLTEAEIDKCRAYLSLHDQSWPEQRQVVSGSILYLDDSAVSILEHLGLLAMLHRAGFTLMVGRSVAEQADALVGYDSQSAEATAVLERVRCTLRSGIQSGRVRTIYSRDTNEAGRAHPTLDIFKAAIKADAIVVDDRFLNQHQHVDVDSVQRAILSTVDILEILRERDKISDATVDEARTKLRRANMAMVPVDQRELQRFLARATVISEVLHESAELRAIREHVLRLQMTDILQLPIESAWLQSLRRACLSTLKTVWQSAVPMAEIHARADWLLHFIENHDWIHRMGPMDLTVLEQLQRHCVLELIHLMLDEPAPLRQEYWHWLEDRVLTPMAEQQPDLFAWFAAYTKDLMERVVNDAMGSFDHA